ncbi:unnamed protein product [Arabidopsis thaliana]|uniref:(thale cress) hypothetical protein n=1 Tax=Arabidopsis thaliana TaxID=3702 RepID=A0A7G2ERR2_ARATH|nr:unnamed protein product [Arabidopsis thaliana]
MEPTHRALPVGFRFRPTNCEISNYFLKKKALGQPMKARTIPEECHDIFSRHPHDLPGYPSEEHWYYFCRKRDNQVTSNSHNLWTPIGEETNVLDPKNNDALSEESHELTNGISEEKESKETMKSQKADRRKKKLKDKLLKEASKADNRGVCYLSRIPPHMDHVRLRHILAQYGELGRIYLAPEDSEAQVHRKRAGGFRGQRFSEGWVEFAKKSVAKRVADMLNGEQIGGKKKSSVYYDIWNIKYLTKFKWDDLTEEIAYKSAIREQKLNMVLSAAKREKDFYLSKIEKSRAMTEIDARMEKKRKIQEESGSNAEAAPVFPPRAIFQFRQKKSIENETSQSKPGLSTDFLASVFGGS